jgi:hypothetical protein
MFWYRDYSTQYRCGACHVRTGTLAFGIAQMCVMAFAVVFFGVCFLQPNAIPKPVQDTFLRTFDLFTMGYASNPSGKFAPRTVDAAKKAENVQTPIDVELFADGTKQSAASKSGKSDGIGKVDKGGQNEGDALWTYMTKTAGENGDESYAKMFNGKSKGSSMDAKPADVQPKLPDYVTTSTQPIVDDWFVPANQQPSSRRFTMSKWSDEDRIAVLVLLALGLSVTSLLCAGILKRRPSWMMPYFCLQLFDLCITCISMLGYFANVPNPKDFAETHVCLTTIRRLPIRTVESLCKDRINELNCVLLYRDAIVTKTR